MGSANTVYQIVGISAYPDELRNFIEPLLLGVRQLGHAAAYMSIGLNSVDQMVSALRQRRPDFCFLTGRTVSGLVAYQPKALDALRAEGVPLLYLWYDNPLRSTRALARAYHDNVLGLTTPDTQTIPHLQALGVSRVMYSPVIEGDEFRALPARNDLACECSFAGGYMTREYLERVYIPSIYDFPELSEPHQLNEHIPALPEYRRLIELFVQTRETTRHYVDAYTFMRAHSAFHPGTVRFDRCSNLLMHYQKTLEREHLFDALAGIPELELRVYGGADASLDHQRTMGSRWPHVRFYGALDRNTVFPALFPSTNINLGLSQFARAVHGRYIENAACGGFMLAEYKADVDLEFDVGKEIVCYRNWDELKDLTIYYRRREAERKAIARQGRDRYLKTQRPKHRWQALMPAIRTELARYRDTVGSRA